MRLPDGIPLLMDFHFDPIKSCLQCAPVSRLLPQARVYKVWGNVLIVPDVACVAMYHCMCVGSAE